MECDMVGIDRKGWNIQQAIDANGPAAHRRHQLTDIFDMLCLRQLRQRRSRKRNRLDDRAIYPDDTGTSGLPLRDGFHHRR